MLAAMEPEAIVDANFSGAPGLLRLLESLYRQDWPTAALYVVATPIGNRGDLSLRAQVALQKADVIAAEDTRQTRPLMEAWGIATPLIAAHRHNEAAAASQIVERLQRGERVALVSDAGAPGVSDPGARIVRAVRDAGFRVVPLPGASAVITALMGAGVTTDENPAFVFAGFAPSKSTARKKWFEQWSTVAAPVVMYESPHRLAQALKDLETVAGPARRVTLARELTKRFESIVTLPLGEVQAWLRADAHRAQGEFVLILEAPLEAEPVLDAQVEQWLQALLPMLSVKDCAKVAAQVTGLPKDALYARAQQLKERQSKHG